MDEKIKKVIFNLKQNNMLGFYVENTQELHTLLSSLIIEGEKIGCGDSITLEETKVFEYIQNGNFTFYNKH